MKHLICLNILLSVISTTHADNAQPMNVLMIAVDDLNHWVDYTGRNEQTKTPNIKRLSDMGVSFTNVHCTAPACNPSRASLMSGMRPSTTGCYKNGDFPWTNFIEKDQTMESHFKNSGYTTLAAGKIYHNVGIGKGYKSTWDEYAPVLADPQGNADKFEGFHDEVVTEMNDQSLSDWHFVDYAIEQLNKDHEKPFFLACGLFKPHLAWAVPRKYYDMFPLETIELPHMENDLDDLPEAGVKMARPDGDHAKILQANRWKKAIQSYLASIAYTDMNIGRLLDAFEKSKYRDNTIVVLWSDHGWALGEKKHWRKFALWEETTRTIMIWKVPGLTNGGLICDQPIDYLTVFPTLCDLSKTARPAHLEGASIKPLLRNPNSDWDGFALTTHGYMNHAIRTERWRYIRYADGSEELYDHSKDPYEFKNLARAPEFKPIKIRLARNFPKVNVPPADDE